VSFRTTRRGGEYLRVADPAWDEPLDGRYAQRSGGRWNAPGSFPVVYLNADVATARANVALRFEGRPFSLEDLDPDEAPVLVATEVATADFVDVLSDEGSTAAGLPATYPLQSGKTIPYARCQPIGQQAWDEGHPGIACRSAAGAAAAENEELAWFEREEKLAPATTTAFESWYW
jgi:hypothetical protein